jgi:hypothetical protein
MSRFSVYRDRAGWWVVYYNNAAAQRVIVDHFECAADAWAYAARENARLWPQQGGR